MVLSACGGIRGTTAFVGFAGQARRRLLVGGRSDGEAVQQQQQRVDGRILLNPERVSCVRRFVGHGYDQ